MVVACSGAAPSFGAAHRAAIVDSVHTMLGAWHDAFNAKDFAKAASYYSGDSAFRWIENGELKFQSARQLRDTMLAEAPAFKSLEMSLIEPVITAVAPGVAEVSSGFAQKITDNAGQSFGLAGAMSMTVVHGDSGWKFLVGHVSVVRPPVDTIRKGKHR